MDKLKLAISAIGFSNPSNIGAQSEQDRQWLDYNYPPKLRLIHYSLQGLQQPFKRISQLLHANVFIVIAIQLLSLANCFSQIANASSCEKIRVIFVLYAFLSKCSKNPSHLNSRLVILDVILWPMLAFYTFYQGHYTVCKGPNHQIASKMFYIAQTIQCVLFFIFTIIHSGAFNGFTKLGTLSSCGLTFSLVCAIIEIVLYYISIVVGMFCLLTIKKSYGVKEPYLP